METKTRKIDGFEYRRGVFGRYYASLETVLAHAKKLGYTLVVTRMMEYHEHPIDFYREMAKNGRGVLSDYDSYRLQLPRAKSQYPQAWIKTEHHDIQGLTGAEIIKPKEGKES